MTRLTELTLRDVYAGFLCELVDAPAMRAMLMDPPQSAVLPASMQLLRVKASARLQMSRKESDVVLATTTIPVLELGTDMLSLTDFSTDPAGEGFGMFSDNEPAQLPGGFSALWLRTGCIAFQFTGHADDGNPHDVEGIDLAEELCCFLASRPSSYREFRLFGDAKVATLTVRADWVPEFDGEVEHKQVKSHSLKVWAAVIRQFAPAHGPGCAHVTG
jgi:hypothetical protein